MSGWCHRYDGYDVGRSRKGARRREPRHTGAGPDRNGERRSAADGCRAADAAIRWNQKERRGDAASFEAWPRGRRHRLRPRHDCACADVASERRFAHHRQHIGRSSQRHRAVPTRSTRTTAFVGDWRRRAAGITATARPSCQERLRRPLHARIVERASTAPPAADAARAPQARARPARAA